MKKIVIVGGGISGLCSAYYLAKEGHDITVIDKGNISTGASFINAGYITPSHFISLAAPGTVVKGLKWMFNSSSPFYIKPRWDPEFFRWGYYFIKSATSQKVEKSISVLKEINLKSRGLYEEMFSSPDFDFHYENKGLLLVYKTEEGKKNEFKLAGRAVKEGLDAVQLSKEELQKIQPGFSENVIGAVHYKCDSHTTPNHFMPAMKKWLEKKGVKFFLNEEVTNIRSDRDKIVAVETGTNTFEADEFVMAAGSWTSSLAKSLGLKIPIQGGKGYSMDMHRAADITIPAVLVEAKVGVTPMDGFIRFAGTMEFSGNNTLIRRNRVEAIANSVKEYYRDVVITEAEKDAARSGLRPVSPDGLPFIGRSTTFQNLTIAAGHAMIGWSLGPATGKLVSQVIEGQDPLMDLKPFNPDRF